MTFSAATARTMSPFEEIRGTRSFDRTSLFHQEGFMFAESQNFIEWSKWDKLLRDHSTSSREHSPPPQMIAITPPSTPGTQERKVNLDASLVHQKDSHHRHHTDSRYHHSHSHRHYDSARDSSGVVQKAKSEAGGTSNHRRHHHHHYHDGHDDGRHQHHHGAHHHRHYLSHDDSDLYLTRTFESDDLPPRTNSSHSAWRPQYESFYTRQWVDDDFGQEQHYIPRRAMSEGDFEPRRWTDFGHSDSTLYHLSDRRLDCSEEVPAQPKPQQSDLSSMQLPAKTMSLLTERQTKSESCLVDFAGRLTLSEGATEESGNGTKKWSPKRLVCRSASEMGSVAPKTPLLPPPPDFSRCKRHGGSHVSVQTAPATYLRLDSKKHDDLEEMRKRQIHRHLTSKYHQEFKQRMKMLLEQEYSPHYVKQTPSLLSHLAGEPPQVAWKSPSRRRKSRRDWYERSDSKKGRMVSEKMRSMNMVFFETTFEDKEESFDTCISTIEEDDECDEEEYDNDEEEYDGDYDDEEEFEEGGGGRRGDYSEQYLVQGGTVR